MYMYMSYNKSVQRFPLIEFTYKKTKKNKKNCIYIRPFIINVLMYLRCYTLHVHMYMYNTTKVYSC